MADRHPYRPAPPSDDRQPSSPYGPQPHGVDQAAGGADSSPHEAESSVERHQTQSGDEPDKPDGSGR